MTRISIFSTSLFIRTIIGALLFIGLFFSNSEGIRLLPFATDPSVSAYGTGSPGLSASPSDIQPNYNFSVRELSSKRLRTTGKENRNTTEFSPAAAVSANLAGVEPHFSRWTSTNYFCRRSVVANSGTHPAVFGRAPPTLLA